MHFETLHHRSSPRRRKSRPSPAAEDAGRRGGRGHDRRQDPRGSPQRLRLALVRPEQAGRVRRSRPLVAMTCRAQLRPGFPSPDACDRSKHARRSPRTSARARREFDPAPAPCQPDLAPAGDGLQSSGRAAIQRAPPPLSRSPQAGHACPHPAEGHSGTPSRDVQALPFARSKASTSRPGSRTQSAWTAPRCRACDARREVARPGLPFMAAHVLASKWRRRRRSREQERPCYQGLFLWSVPESNR